MKTIPKVGQKVHYIPFKGCGDNIKENGKVKSIADSTHARVVYNCNGEWNKLDEYTSCLTDIRDLEPGWLFGTRNAMFCSKEDIEQSNN